MVQLNCDRKVGVKDMERPLLIFQKNADVEKIRVIIPKTFIEKFGRNFSMEVYEDKIILKPIKKGD